MSLKQAARGFLHAQSKLHEEHKIQHEKELKQVRASILCRRVVNILTDTDIDSNYFFQDRRLNSLYCPQIKQKFLRRFAKAISIHPEDVSWFNCGQVSRATPEGKIYFNELPDSFWEDIQILSKALGTNIKFSYSTRYPTLINVLVEVT